MGVWRSVVTACTVVVLLTSSGCGTLTARGTLPEIAPVTTPVSSTPHSHRPGDCENLRSDLRRDGEVNGYGTSGPRIGVIGDSYTEGIGLSHVKRRWVAQLSRLMHARVRADGVGYTGFVNGGPCGGQSYLTRVGRLTGQRTVLLEGGLNDLRASPARVTAAAVKLAEQFPHARVVIIGPVNAPKSTGEPAVDRALRAAARQAGVGYLSMLHLDPAFLPEGIHMTGAGHLAFARRVASYLR